MSFRLYPSNPVLQRLRDSGDIKATSQTVSVPSPPAVISGYGELSSPDSFSTFHGRNPLFRRRRSSAPPQLSVPDNSPSEIQMPSAIQIQNPIHEEIPHPTPQSDPKGPEVTLAQTSKPILTSRPVFLRDQSPDDADITNAVILRAKWQKLSHATARRIRLLPKMRP